MFVKEPQGSCSCGSC